MVPEVASCNEAVAVDTKLHLVCVIRPSFQEQVVPVQLVTFLYDGHVVFVYTVPPDAFD